MMNTRSLTLALALSCCAGIVHAQTNVLPNGSFDSAQQVTGWTYVPVVAGDGAMTWNSDDANGNPNSGSLQIDYVQGGAALSACFAVTPAASFAFGGKSKAVSGSPRNLMVCTGYTDDTCSLGGQTVAYYGSASFTWGQLHPSYPVGNVMPIGLNFVQCNLSADRFIGSTGGAMRYDDLTFYSPAGTPVSLQSFNVE